MSNRLRQLFIALVMLLSLLAACQPKGPQIEITPSERDLGQVAQQPLETTYTVRNRGNQALEIGKVYTNCDCTSASVDSKTLAPGEETILRVTMDPAQLDLYGNIRREIILETNDPRTPIAKVLLKVTIDKP